MSGFYKPDRGPKWNYGGESWRLSRSKIDLFMECAQCFYIDNKLGTKRPPGFPFNLNSAVDALLKKEFDVHRTNKSPHPLMNAYGVDAVPFEHPQMDAWRDALKRGVEYRHQETNLLISGAVDDIWVRPNGELIVVDYKATSKDGKITELNEEWHRGYKRQLEIYQWLLRKNGFNVSSTSYWVYANARTDKEAFDAQLEFEITLVPYQGDDSWIEAVLREIKVCLDSDELPKASPECDYCLYRNTVGKKLMARYVPKATIKRASKVEDSPDTATLGL